MEDKTELSQWVEKLANDGTWNSEGAFTLERKKAWEKLGGSQLPFPEAWALKLVQSAVLSVCQGLVVRQSGSEVVFRFAGQTSWTPELVSEALFSPGGVSDGGVAPLAAAIRQLAHQPDRLVALQFSNGSTQVWDGHRLRTEQSPQTCDSFQLSVFFARRDGGLWSLFSGSDQMDRVLRCLRENAYSSPIPIVIDGSYANGFSHDPHGGATSSTSPFAALVLKPDVHLAPFRFLRDTKWTPSTQEMSVQLKGASSELTGEPVEAGALVFLTASVSEAVGQQRFQRQPGYLKWVKHGVLVKMLRFSPVGSVGLTIIVNADDLSTDLSGLKLAEGSEYLRRKKHVFKRVRARLRELLEEKSHTTLSLRMRGKPHKLAMLGSLGAGFFQPFFFGVTALVGAQYLSDRLWVRNREWQLAEDMAALCSRF